MGKVIGRIAARRLDRNGIPILDPPSEANKLPRRCAGENHTFVRVGRRFTTFNPTTGARFYEVEYRCDRCTAKSVDTEVED